MKSRIIVLAVLFYASSSAQGQLEELRSHDVQQIMSLIEQRHLWKQFQKAELDISDKCRRHASALSEHLSLKNGPSFWAVKMHDASGHGKPDAIQETGLMVSLVGSYSSCVEINVLEPTFNGTKLEPFGGRYVSGNLVGFPSPNEERDSEAFSVEEKLLALRHAKAGHIIDPKFFTFYAIWRVGLCVPSSCSKDESTLGFNAMLAEQASLFNTNWFFGAASSTAFNSTEPDQVHGLDWLMISLLIFFGSCLILGTVIDMTTWSSSESIWIRFLLAFSLTSNLSSLFAITSDETARKHKDDLRCLYGLRFISMTWVVEGHVYAFLLFNLPSTNLDVFLYKASKDFWIQAILNALPSVDTFFFLSGLLVTYFTLRELDKTKGRMNWAMFYVHRYIRLTGIYAILILFYVTLLRYAYNFGAYNTAEQSSYGCKADWWRQLLYINNIFYGDYTTLSACMGQSWYLACDLQMFIVSPLIIYPLWRWRKAGIAWVGVWILALTTTIAGLTITRGWPAQSNSPLATKEPTDYMEENYFKPWCRMQPYLAGMLLAHLLWIQDGKKVKLSKLTVAAGWLLASLTGFAVIYGLNYPRFAVGQVPTVAENVIYGSLHRLTWGLCLSWVVWACVKGYGGVVNRILSWKAFGPLSRLSYVIYLIHLDLINIIAASFTFPTHFSHFFMSMLIMFILVVCSVLALLVTLYFEIPLTNLEKLVFRRGSPRKKKV